MATGGSWRDPEYWFVGRRIVNQDRYDAARALGGDVVERLLEGGDIDERVAWQFRAMSMGIGYVDLDRIQIALAATLCLPSDLAREIGVLPLKLDGKTLYAAFRDTSDREALERAQEASGLRVTPVVVTPTALEAALRRL